MFYALMEKEEFSHWKVNDIPRDLEAKESTRQRLKSNPPPPWPLPRLSFRPPEAMEIEMRSTVPAGELEPMLSSSFTSPKELAEEAMRRFGLNIYPTAAFLLFERSKELSSGGAGAVVEVGDELKLEGTLFVSVSHIDHPSQSIYAVDLAGIEPVPVQPSDIQATYRPSTVSQSKIEPSLVLEFARDKRDMFPCYGVSCVNLNKKLYLIGGFQFDSGERSRNVYCVELDEISKNMFPRFTEVASMIHVKPQCYIFVAGGQIYVISPANPWFVVGRFEVYDPESDDWSILPEPPFRHDVISDSVFGGGGGKKVVVLGTYDEGFFCFDLERGHWNNYSPLLYFNLNGIKPLSHSIQVGDRLYCDSARYNVACFGPVPNADSDVSDIKKLFRESGLRNEQLSCDIRTFSPNFKVTSSLHYLGNKTFIYINGGYTHNPFSDDDYKEEEEVSTSTEACDIRLLVFKIPEDEEQRTFSPQLVHVVELMCKSEQGVSSIDDSFVVTI